MLDATDLGVIAAGAYGFHAVFSWAATIGNNQILKARSSTPDVLLSKRRSRCWSTSRNIKQPASRPSTCRNRPQAMAWFGHRRFDFFHRGAQHGCEKSINGFGSTLLRWVARQHVLVGFRHRIRCPPGSIHKCRSFASHFTDLRCKLTDANGQIGVVGTMCSAGLNWHDDVEFLNNGLSSQITTSPLRLRTTKAWRPGQTSTLTFLIKNTGVLSDDYTVTQSNLSGWVTAISPSSQTASISQDATTPVTVSVEVQITIRCAPMQRS